MSGIVVGATQDIRSVGSGTVRSPLLASPTRFGCAEEHPHVGRDVPDRADRSEPARRRTRRRTGTVSGWHRSHGWTSPRGLESPKGSEGERFDGGPLITIRHRGPSSITARRSTRSGIWAMAASSRRSWPKSPEGRPARPGSAIEDRASCRSRSGACVLSIGGPRPASSGNGAAPRQPATTTRQRHGPRRSTTRPRAAVGAATGRASGPAPRRGVENRCRPAAWRRAARAGRARQPVPIRSISNGVV